jgi:hypothetical protein
MKLLIAGLSLLALAAGLLAFTDVNPATPFIAGVVGTFIGVVHAVSPTTGPAAPAYGALGEAQDLARIASSGSPAGDAYGGDL